jgi:2-methylfumaryl-CoA isomerase
MGNDLFGAFGRDFMTADGQRIMVVALTSRQWSDLVGSLAIAHLVESIQAKLGVSFADDAGLRFQHRDELFPIVESAIGEHSLSHLASAFKGTGVCWGPYQTLKMALETDARFGAGSDVLEPVDHVSGFRYPTPGFAGTLDNSPRLPPRRAPRLGEHTDEILSEALGLSSKQIGDLLSRRIVADDREARKEMTR